MTLLSYIPGRKGANQAVAMARLGADVEMFGCVGDDSHGQALIVTLQRKGLRQEISEKSQVYQQDLQSLQ